MDQSHRNTIFCEDARVLDHQAWPDRQHVLTLHAPRCATAATPGSFIHLRCDADIAMRRPLSIMHADAADGSIEVLYKVVGAGLEALSHKKRGDELNVLGPVGRGFAHDSARPRAVLIGGGVGIPPLVFLARHLARKDPRPPIVAFFGSESPFPFPVDAASLPVPGVPQDATDCMRLLEDSGIPSRLASRAGLAGSHRGLVTELAAICLEARPREELAATTLYACGPEPMLRAVQALASSLRMPSQLCLEEFMACAVGGCAGCVVPLVIGGERQMKRVCVDGPVFDGAQVYPTASDEPSRARNA